MAPIHFNEVLVVQPRRQYLMVPIHTKEVQAVQHHPHIQLSNKALHHTGLQYSPLRSRFQSISITTSEAEAGEIRSYKRTPASHQTHFTRLIARSSYEQ